MKRERIEKQAMKCVRKINKYKEKVDILDNFLTYAAKVRPILEVYDDDLYTFRAKTTKRFYEEKLAKWRLEQITLQSKCDHKEADGENAYKLMDITNGNVGIYKCSICQHTFKK